MGTTARANRLIREKSPYLQQHAHNPVDWFPWGEEAFRKARDENKPLLLSIGYSTCHWCHVMERESFEDAETAALMNASYVPVKVDREERPDIDAVYMKYVTATTGHGGWPMTVFLTPDRLPFYGGTYFPPQDRYGIPGFRTLLNEIAGAWKERRSEIEESAHSAASFLSSRRVMAGAHGLDSSTLAAAAERLDKQADDEWGGFGRAPKFPRPHTLGFLLRHKKRTGSERSGAVVRRTLDRMAEGGLRDHLGGGFHRYSVDSFWRIPHFEKMLYDQALLVIAYLEGYQAAGDETYAVVARETLDYVLAEMRSSDGAFFSAQDADSVDPSAGGEKKEGAFFLWTRSELTALLGADAELFAFRYGVEANGNAPQDPHGEFAGKNVLYLAHTLEETAARFGKKPADIERSLADSRAKLLEARRTRPAPHRDEKILTDWNALLITALATASRVLGETGYRDAAARAGLFLKTLLKSAEGRLLHRYCDGEAGIPGNLDDHAFFAEASLALYEATFDESWLAEAKALADAMISLFWDEEAGGFYMTASDAEELVTRPKENYDGAVPSGNSVAAHVLLKLTHITGEASYAGFADKTFVSAAGAVAEEPTAYPRLLSAFDFALGPVSEVVLAGAPTDPGFGEFVKRVYSGFTPDKVVLFHKDGPAGALLERLAPFVADKRPVSGKFSAYVCRGRACRQPVTDAEEFSKVFEETAAQGHAR